MRANVPKNARLLLNRGYLSLVATQFLGAANDNILKHCLTFMVATGIWSGSLAEGGLGQGGQVVPALLLTLPFIFLSGYAGQVADRFSKQRVMFWVKVAELPIAILAMFGFLTQNLWLTLFSLLMLSVQSSFFGPAKYGVIPELVPEHRLSMANGVLNMLSNLAVIVGSLAAGPLSDAFNPKSRDGEMVAAPLLWAPGAALIAVALLGIVSVLPMPKLVPANPKLRYEPNPFATYWQSLQEMAGGPLLAVTISWSAFYMIAWMALLIIPEYERILAVSYTQVSYLLGGLGIYTALGSFLTGIASGRHIRPWFIPFGASGMTISFLLLGLLDPTYVNVFVLICTTGFFAGFYIVPLQSLMQALSPEAERGRFLGTANALSFCFTSVGSVIFWVATNRIGLPANRVHLICGTFALVGTVVGVAYLRSVPEASDEGSAGASPQA